MLKRPDMPTALITGGSRGLGSAFANRLAADGYDLVVVARDHDQLRRAALDLRARYGIAVEVLPADLTDPVARRVVEQRLADARQPIELLVNNAGVHAADEFASARRDDLQREIDLNVTAVLHLTHAVLPGMLTRGRGAVINVASFAGYLSPRGSAYGSTKAWVLNFTDTIAASTKPHGVRIVALCPGRLGRSSGSVLLLGTPLRLNRAWVVDTCLADLQRGRTLSVPGWPYRVVVDYLEGARRTLRLLARLIGHGRDQRSQPLCMQPPAGETLTEEPASSAPPEPG